MKFFVDVNKEMKRDYVLIIDKSGSMGGGGGWGKKSLWEEAREAISYLKYYKILVFNYKE